MNPVEKLAADIRAVDGDHKLGAAELAAELVKLGWVRPAAVVDAKTLQPGDVVEVLKDGTWMLARIAQITAGSLIEADTERGPWSGYAKREGTIRFPVPKEL